MALGEAFTVLAVLEATDRMSRVLEKVDGSLGKFSETASKAAEVATEAGAKIDESLLRTASGADAVELADARLVGAQARLAAATKAQADAERALLDAQAKAAAAADGDTAATEKLAAASSALTKAQRDASKASAEVSAAQDRQAAVTKATAAANTTAATETDAAAAAQTRLGKSSEEAGAKSGIASKAMKFGALAIAAVGYESIKAAGNFESMTQHLVTDAGESQSNLAMIRSGMLQIATVTGTTTEQMAAGMYHIESAGFHGKAALDVLRTAAEGAKVGGADLDTIGQALTGTMNAFSKEGLTSTQMMNGLIATVGQGDMKLQDLGSSLGNVAAIGAAAHLKFSQVAGAIATMTAQNVSAQRATQDLAHTIGSLGNPTKVMATEMSAMGLDANDVAKNLGNRGLTGTIDVLVQAIANNTKGGEVFVQALNKSKAAASAANQALAQMPASMKKLAESWQNGTTSTKTFNAAIKQLPPAQQTLYTQFESLVKKSGSFTDALKANNPTAQTFNAALAKMTGGTTSLNTILMLSGAHSQTFKDNVDKIQGSVSKTGSSVENWSSIQGTFNQKMDRLKASVEATGISIGTALLPVVSKIASMVVSVVTPVANWIAKHQSLSAIILGSLAGFLALAGAISGISKAVSLVTGTFDKLKTGFQAVAKGAGLVKDGVSKIPWSSMASGASSAWDTVSGKASDAWTAVQSGASTATSAVQDFGSKVATAASGAASSAWRTLSSGMSAATTATKAAAAATLDFSKSLIASAASGLRAAGAWALEKVQLVATTVAEKAAAAAEWLLNAAMDANPITLIILALVALAAGFAYLWTHSAAFRDFWISAWHDIESAAQTVWGWLQTAFHAMMSLIDTVVGFVRSHWPLLLAIITGPIGMAVYLITKYWSDIKKFFLEGVHTALAYLEGLAQIPVKVGAWFLSMAAKVGHGIDVAVTWVAGLPGRFMQWLGQLGQDAINVGVNFMQGLWNGLVSMASWLGSQVMGLVKDVIPGPILKVLGISSPSKWAHWAGQMVGHGLANGMSSMHDHVANASANLAKAVTKGSLGAINLAGAQVAGSLTVAAGLPAAAAGGVAINIDLRGSTVSSDADRRKLAQEIGNEVVKQVARAGIKARAF